MPPNQVPWSYPIPTLKTPLAGLPARLAAVAASRAASCLGSPQLHALPARAAMSPGACCGRCCRTGIPGVGQQDRHDVHGAPEVHHVHHAVRAVRHRVRRSCSICPQRAPVLTAAASGSCWRRPSAAAAARENRADDVRRDRGAHRAAHQRRVMRPRSRPHHPR